MVDIKITEQVCAGEAFLLPDSVWRPDLGMFDWALARSDEPMNVGGLQSTNGLHTAVALLLFTDRRVDPSHPCFYLCDGDPGGWWGDGVDVREDLQERPLGSLLWLLRRAPMTINGVPVETWARQFAVEALQPLLDQGAAARIEVVATANAITGRLELIVRLFGVDGLTKYDSRFEILWNQVAR